MEVNDELDLKAQNQAGESSAPAETSKQRKPYSTPTFVEYGSVTEVTQGSVTGSGADIGSYSGT